MEAVAQAETRQVEHDVGPTAGLLDRAPVPHVAQGEHQSWVIGDGDEILGRPRGEVVENVQFAHIVGLEEMLDEVASQEPCAAGDEDALSRPAHVEAERSVSCAQTGTAAPSSARLRETAVSPWRTRSAERPSVWGSRLP